MPGPIAILSGGSAANALVDVFAHVASARRAPLAYIIPISDNGGSSSELIRVLGGPGIGDVRSRLVRLIPGDDQASKTTHDHDDDAEETSEDSDIDAEDEDAEERAAIRTLFNHRLPSDSASARAEWLDIVEARSALWTRISSPKRELVRAYLNTLNMELVRRVRPSSVFDFARASVGNMFLTGARLHLGSFEAAIYLLSAVCEIPAGVRVLPAINTNFTHHIAARLADGSEVRGQNEISHPSAPVRGRAREKSIVRLAGAGIEDTDAQEVVEDELDELDHADTIEDANLPGSLPVLRRPYLTFNKTPGSSTSTSTQPEAPANPTPSIATSEATTSTNPTPSITTSNQILQSHPDALAHPIRSLYYINPYGQPIRPYPNPHILTTLSRSQAIIFSIGSLYTSLAPSLVLRGVGAAIASSSAPKILLLNGSLDRETVSVSNGAYDALDFVRTVARCAGESRRGGAAAGERVSGAVTPLREPSVAPLASAGAAGAAGAEEDEDAQLSSFVTHVIYVDAPGAPVVDRAALLSRGIEPVRVYGKRDPAGRGARFDLAALAGALEGVLVAASGKGAKGGVGRRNTMGV